MQRIVLQGRLGKDWEERVSPGGKKSLSASLAVPHYKGTIWYTLMIPEERMAHFTKILPYLTKGKGVLVGGTLLPPTPYEKKNGELAVNMAVMPDFLEFVLSAPKDEPPSAKPPVPPDGENYELPF